MEYREYGNSGIKISIIGFGAGQIGGDSISENEIDKLLNQVLDSGINLIDTARSYGASEERIGRVLSKRRSEFNISTKVGYGIEGVADWSFDAVTKGIEEALTKLRTDYIDIVHLHSCPLETLLRGEVIEALEKSKSSGKILVAAYSGENEALKYAAASGRFGGIQTSVNLFDQIDIGATLTEAKNNSIGVIAKRPSANAPWRFDDQPLGDYCEEYWKRMKRMKLSTPFGWQETALRFAAYTEGVTAIITGTTKAKHLAENISLVEKGPLPAEFYEEIRTSFKFNNNNWRGQI